MSIPAKKVVGNMVHIELKVQVLRVLRTIPTTVVVGVDSQSGDVGQGRARVVVGNEYGVNNQFIVLDLREHRQVVQCPLCRFTVYE